jgi:hypothetical protein
LVRTTGSVAAGRSALADRVNNVLLYAALKDGQLSGKFFNKNANITITQITEDMAMTLVINANEAALMKKRPLS